MKSLAITVVIMGLVLRLNCFDLESDIEFSNVLSRIERRKNDEKEFIEGKIYPPILPEERCDSPRHDLEKRSAAPSDAPLSRKKRAIIAWPQRSKFTAEIYYAIPLISPPQIVVPVAFGIPFTFDIPNSTDSLHFRRRSIQDRYNIYGVIEGLIENFGFEGRSCIQRAICERSEHHFLTTGILSELVNLILRVTTTSTDGLMYDYVEAEKHGRKAGNCHERFSRCPFSLFNFISGS